MMLTASLFWAFWEVILFCCPNLALLIMVKKYWTRIAIVCRIS